MNLMASPDLRADDDHLRHLLDQRAARADLHGRFPSLSEFSDSPSVYSHPHFSPRPPDRPFLHGHPSTFRFPQGYSPSLDDREPRSPITDRERLNIPNASSLDLEDDPRSSSEYQSFRDDEPDSPDEFDEPPQVSMYGPKMRFHSPAPWEEDGAEQRSFPDDLPKRSKKKSEPSIAKKAWGLSRSSGDTRPSTDSVRSGKGKQSFDAQSNFSASGALAALAQASMSTTSLAVHQSPQSLRDKLSLPRLRTRSPSNVGPLDAVSPSNASPITRIGTPPHGGDDYEDDRSVLGLSSARAGTPQQEYTHPYANPDLVRAQDFSHPPSPSQMSFVGARGPPSTTMLTETTLSSSLSQFRSTTTLAMTPGTSTTSMNPSLNDSFSSSRLGSKGIGGISSPIPVDKASLHPDVLGKLNGFQASPISAAVSPIAPRHRDTSMSAVTMGGLSTWAENPAGGALKLISLEEAQAQARVRSVTAHPTVSSPYALSNKSPFPEVDADAQHAQGRARSSSAGGKGRNTFDSPQRFVPPVPLPGDSPVSGPSKQVVRKKSGFMRLFNNGKDRTSPSSPPPPVPSFTNDAFAAQPPSQPPVTFAHRVPVPVLSPSLLGEPGGRDSSSPGDSPPSTDSSSHTSSAAWRDQQQLSYRRKVPELSIVTAPSSASTLAPKAPFTAPLSANSSDASHHHLTPTTSASHLELRPAGSSPSSAPPTKTDFVGLSIRPMSTLFTRELKELAATERPSLEGYGSATSNDEKQPPLSFAHDGSDQSIIHALQEQILSTRRAWQRQIWELEGQVRDLKAEVEELRSQEAKGDYCASCGRGSLALSSAGSDDAGSGRRRRM
ncbi:uncharacterized protein BXZ73DRAFT_87076 [Epithele typhae]|uniref:uncharacterized protein n=1 Tax=Epithele typhae TaxID=378194 RepID=UPI0020082F93|nr:uncharacterized protein BXZ73DRAFT_87076 [Epithele typhae]KAH9944119.1 hypothetical protein BXZ73DRAFT_87076 [Epithele typhae]